MFSTSKYLPSAQATLEAGEQLGESLLVLIRDEKLRLPLTITLSGDLGAGKTTLCQGLCRSFADIDPGEVLSPTFTLANEYHGGFEIYHLDLYRLETVDQFYDAGLDEYLTRPGLSLIEWPEKMPSSFWPADRLVINLNFAEDGGRELVYSGNYAVLAGLSGRRV